MLISLNMDFFNYAGHHVNTYWPLYDNLYICTWYGEFFKSFLEHFNGATNVVYECLEIK